MKPRSKLFPTPEDAENAFYDAFERANIALMMAVWAVSDDVVCIHPRGPRLTGFDAVRESWVQIFAGGATLKVRTTEARKFAGQALAVHSVVELVSPPGGEGSPTPVFATNIFLIPVMVYVTSQFDVMHMSQPQLQAAVMNSPASQKVTPGASVDR